MSLSVSYSWSVDVAPEDLAEWVVYASTDRAAKGQEVARVPGSERYATWVSDESLIYVRVLAVKRNGAEEPWDGVDPDEVLIQGRDSTKEPDAPTNVAVGIVDLSQSARVEVDPPARSDVPAFVQVIEGADAETGKLIAEHKVIPSGPIGVDGPPKQVSMPVPLDGTGGTKALVVRHMGTTGRASSDVARTVRQQDDLPQFHAVPVCSWSGTTLTNVPAAATTDAHEFDATHGARARAKPTIANATAANGWGTLAAGLLADAPVHGAYLPTITVESNEVDLGATLTFRLTAVDTVGRATAAGTSRPLWATKVPLIPAAHPDVRLSPEGAAWASRETRVNGKPRQPVRSWRWEYVVGTSSPVAHASSDYRPLAAGQLLNGRYVRVRLVVTDPTGQHRVICPSASVIAHVFRRTLTGAGSPESSIVAPPGSHYFRTDGPPHHYVKVTGVGNTGWSASNDGASGAPSAHATSHQNGGTDEISVAGLSGELADVQPPKIDGLTAETTVDRDADYVPMYDASASANRKVAVRDLASGAIARDSTHVDVGPSDTTEISIFSKSIIANLLGTDRMLRLSIRGTAKNFSGSGRAFQIRVKFGGTTLADFNLSLASYNTLTTFHLAVELQNDGATNAQWGTAVFCLPVPSAPGTGTAGGLVQAGGTRTIEFSGAIDTTANRTFEVTLQLPISDANLYADIERAVLELV